MSKCEPEPESEFTLTEDTTTTTRQGPETSHDKALKYVEVLPVSKLIPPEQIDIAREAVKTAFVAGYNKGYFEGYRKGYFKGFRDKFLNPKSVQSTDMPFMDLKELRENQTNLTYCEVGDKFGFTRVLKLAEAGELKTSFVTTPIHLAKLYLVTTQTVMDAYNESKKRKKAGLYDPIPQNNEE